MISLVRLAKLQSGQSGNSTTMDMWNTQLMRERGVTHLLWPQGGALKCGARAHKHAHTPKQRYLHLVWWRAGVCV